MYVLLLLLSLHVEANVIIYTDPFLVHVYRTMFPR